MDSITDFRTSSIAWLTKDESYGRFALESIYESNSQRYYLGAGVMACKMYVKENLLHNPSYLFQIALSEHDHYMFRSAFKTDLSKDTKGVNKDQFAQVTISEIKSSCKELNQEMIRDALLEGRSLTARITIRKEDGDKNILTFPVRHFNYSDHYKMFQVETGPLIMENEAGAMELGYAAFNNLEQVQIVARSTRNLYDKYRSYDCSTNIYCYTQ